MAEISAKTVMDLRAKTNAGMMDCKKALAESGGDMDKAEEILRKKGITKMEKRTDRVSKEGMVNALLTAGGRSGVLVEVNCETDFVSKNEGWRAFVGDLTQHALGSTADTLEALLAEPYSKGSGSVDEAVKVKGAETGEVTLLRRFTRFTAGADSSVATYLHLGGRIGVMVEVSAGKPATLEADAFKTLLKDLTMHIAAANPEYLSRSDVPAAVVDREKGIYAESDRLKGKPAGAIESILAGMLNKFYSQVCLLEQGFIKDPDQTVSDLVKTTGKSLDDTLTIKRFSRFAVGEELKA
ncbi:MAG TPA: translation elongation factor Ts [Verrucomicrobiales bacterium]|jgi:elongation factor Ts|nr:translation elongation factor Ts [Verrucomicrobiales bacterium]